MRRALTVIAITWMPLISQNTSPNLSTSNDIQHEFLPKSIPLLRTMWNALTDGVLMVHSDGSQRRSGQRFLATLLWGTRGARGRGSSAVLMDGGPMDLVQGPGGGHEEGPVELAWRGYRRCLQHDQPVVDQRRQR